MLFDAIIGDKVGVCVSGGLSSLTVAAALAESGVDTTAFVADIGQASHDGTGALARSLETAGISTVVVDLRERMAELCLDLVRYSAQYEGGYWNTTGASRLVLVEGLGAAMRAAGCTVLAHGCVGGGNDQRRFERYGAAFSPGLRVFVPWVERDLLRRFPDRFAMEKYVLERGLVPSEGSRSDYSVDGNLAGFSHESTALESLETPDGAAELFLTVLPRHARDDAETIAIRFDRGRPVEIDAAAASPREVLARANSLAGRHGIGLRSVVENRINGTKCRGVYEAPGLELLGFCVSRILQVAMDQDARRLLSSLSELIGRAIYEGRYFDAAIQAARAGADVLLEPASATVKVEVHKGGLSFAGMSDCAGERIPPRQTRFTGGGHYWQITQ